MHGLKLFNVASGVCNNLMGLSVLVYVCNIRRHTFLYNFIYIYTVLVCARHMDM